MNKFFKVRNRALQTLVAGLLGLTLYVYYCTTVSEIRPMVAARIGNRSLTPEVPNVSLNVTAEAIISLTQSSARNSSLDASPQSTNSQRPINDPTSGSSSPFVSSSASQASSFPTNSHAIPGNETIPTQQRVSSGKTINESSSTSRAGNATTIAVTIHDDTARAMYRSGHDVRASEKCPKNGTGMNLVIVITSAPGHTESRMAIRQTWGHYDQRRDVAILFMLGSTRDDKLEKSLKNEETLYGDIIRGRYIDSYTNLTLKTISSLEWVSNYCGEAKFMLKTDDDMFINVPRLLSFVRKHERDRNVIFGRLANKWKPIRNKKSKYYVSSSQYKPAVFPDFTTGPAYLISRDVIEKLYRAALDQTYLKLEDVFTTGIVAQKIGIKRSHANEFLNARIPHNACNVQRGISIHMVKYSEQFDLWKKLLDGKSKCK